LNLAGPKQLILIGLILLAASGTLAGTTGKIVGKVTDAKTSKGLNGANVTLVGTKMGAATDLDGSFVIINIPVGTYTVKATLIGYKAVTSTGVRSIQDLTTRLDFMLSNSNDVSIVDVSTEPHRMEASQLKSTIITPHLEQKIPLGKSVIYSSTFQVGWNKLEEEYIKDTIRLAGNPPMAQALNKHLTSRKEISGECYVATAGPMNERLIQQLNQTLMGTIGDLAPQPLKVAIDTEPHLLGVFAYQNKDPQFAKAFYLIPRLLRFDSGDKVDSVIAFGIPYYFPPYGSEFEEAVRVIDYQANQIIIEILCQSKRERLILAKINPQESLIETFKYVDSIVEKRSGSYGGLKSRDRIWIPLLKFDIIHSYNELSGLNLLNESWKDWKLEKAFQWMRFKLSKGGALINPVVEITGVGVVVRPIVEIQGRHFFLDKPFLLYLKQSGSQYPYFAMWVGNTELMVKAK